MVGGPLARIIAQAIVVAGSVVSRAFVHAYAEAAQRAKQGQGAAKTAQAAKDAVLGRNKMSHSEALKILNFTADTPPKDINQVIDRYNRYFMANDPRKGGSFYLQSKIYRAKQTLEEHLSKQQHDTPPPTD